MNAKDLLRAMSDVDDKYLDLVDLPEKEKTPMKQKKPISIRRAVTVLIAAAFCLSLLTVTAYAAGRLPEIFRTMKEKNPEDRALYEAAAQANSEAVPEQVDIVEIPELELSSFTLFERYYDGETILLGYDLSALLPEPAVCAAPESPTLEELQNGQDFSSLGWEVLQDWETAPMTENAKAQGFTGGAERMDRMFRGILSPVAYEEAWRILKKKGHVCVVTGSVWIGDHIWVNGADMGEVLSDEVGNMRWDYQTEQGACTKLTPLPQAGRNQPSVTVTLDVKSCKQYFYLDLDGNTRFLTGQHQQQTLDFTLENVNRQ